MRLVAAPDAAVDRIDRALWLTLGFDKSWLTVSPVVAAGHALAPLAGWVGPASLAEGPRVGPRARAWAEAVRSANCGRLQAVGSVVGPFGRGATAAPIEVGRLERDATAGGPVAGSY